MASFSSPVNLDEAYAFAKTLALEAGQMLMDSLEERRNGTASSTVDSVEKDNAVDIVTKTDEAIESYIHTHISQRYPTHAFIGEESYSTQTSAHSSSAKPYLITPSTPSWVVDPLDGTVNYVHGFPSFAVSIALVLNGEPVLGAICAPFTGQLWHACEGKGSWLSTTAPAGEKDSDSSTQGRDTSQQGISPGPSTVPKIVRTISLPLMRNPIPPLPASAPKGILFSFEWGKDRRDQPNSNLHRKVSSFMNMAAEPSGREGKGGMVHGMRSLGSATLDLAYTAMGAFDVWWEGGCWEWDVAAGIVIVREAGGLVTGANPPEEEGDIGECKLGGRLYLAVRPVGLNEKGESGKLQQEQLVREVWKRVERLDYERPGA